MKYFLYLFLFSCIPVGARAQHARWQAIKTHYNNANNGIPNVIYDLHKDKKGYIWMATQQGLLRYDGANFKLYTTDDGLPDNEVFNLIEDKQERLWLVTYNAHISYLKNNIIYNNEHSSFLREINIKNQNKTYLHATMLNTDSSILFYHHPKDSIIEVKGDFSKSVPPPAAELDISETFWGYIKYKDGTYGRVTSKGILNFDGSGKVLKYTRLAIDRWGIAHHARQEIYLINGKLLNADLVPIPFQSKQQFVNNHYTIPCYVNGVLKIATPAGLYEANGQSTYSFRKPTASIDGALNDTWTGTLGFGIYNQLEDVFSCTRQFTPDTPYYMLPDHMLSSSKTIKMGRHSYVLAKYKVSLLNNKRQEVFFKDSTNKIISVTCDYRNRQLLVCGLKYTYLVKDQQAIKIARTHDFKRMIALHKGYLAMNTKGLHYLDTDFQVKASWPRPNLVNILNVNDSLCLLMNRNYLELVLIKDQQLSLKGIFKSNFISGPTLSASFHNNELYVQTENTAYKFLWKGIIAYPIRLDADLLKINKKVVTGNDITLAFGQHHLVDLNLSHVDHMYGDSQYEYLLYTDEEQETDWINSSKAQITLLLNNPGRYTLMVRAKSANTTCSNTLRYHFTIPMPFWLHPFFLVGMTIAGSAAVFFTIYRIQKKKKERLFKNKELELRFFQSELRSLNALMNPHFTFNALNSIQFLINDRQNEAAQKYLGTFAGLLRRNLYNLQNEFISLESEIELIKSYLKLEQMRLKDNFSYTIQCEADIDLSRVQVPPLLIQPLVENAVIHGVAQYRDQQGMIKIIISSHGNSYGIAIMDNGVASPELNVQKSFGLKNITERIHQVNNRYHKKYTLSIAERHQAEDITWTRLDIILEG